jgi:hypothetical protein
MALFIQESLTTEAILSFSNCKEHILGFQNVTSCHPRNPMPNSLTTGLLNSTAE